MSTYETSFIPPFKGDTSTKGHLSRKDVLQSLLGDETAAEGFVDSIQNYEYLVAAFDGDTVLGVQLCDYDHHEMNIVLGKSLTNPELEAEEAARVKEYLGHIARASYEDMY